MLDFQQLGNLFFIEDIFGLVVDAPVETVVVFLCFGVKSGVWMGRECGEEGVWVERGTD